MPQLSREGHRERMRQAYLSGDMENAPDHNLLELYLSLVIPRKDVKQLSYDLINTFGSLEAVFIASPDELMTVKGVGESTAVAISLVNKFMKTIKKHKNDKIFQIITVEDAKNYCQNLFCNDKVEKVYVITLSAKSRVIGCHKIGEGNISASSVDFRKINTIINKDNPYSVLITHNHPSGSAEPSSIDLQVTIKLKSLLSSLSCSLFDHIIVGEDEVVSIKRDNNLCFNI